MSSGDLMFIHRHPLQVHQYKEFAQVQQNHQWLYHQKLIANQVNKTHEDLVGLI